MSDSVPPPPVVPPAGPPPPRPMQPHRGATILVLGILGFFCCGIPGIIAWVMGNNDLRAMDAGRVDPSGRSITDAGRICGIVSVCLAILGALMWFLWVFFFAVAYRGRMYH